MFRILHRATFAQAPEGTNYEVGDEVIVETTYDSETYRSSMRIVGSAVPKEQTPNSSDRPHLNAAFSAAGAGLAGHVRVGDRFDKQALSRLIEETNYSLRAKGLTIKPDYKMLLHGATEFIVEKIDPRTP